MPVLGGRLARSPLRKLPRSSGTKHQHNLQTGGYTPTQEGQLAPSPLQRPPRSSGTRHKHNLKTGEYTPALEGQLKLNPPRRPPWYSGMRFQHQLKTGGCMPALEGRVALGLLRIPPLRWIGASGDQGVGNRTSPCLQMPKRVPATNRWWLSPFQRCQSGVRGAERQVTC